MTTPGPADRALRVAAVVEPASLLVLLANLATVHVPWVASLVGPVHGTAYLVAIAATWSGGLPRRARLWAWVPGFGALLAARVRPEADGAGPGDDGVRRPVTGDRRPPGGAGYP